MSIQKTQEQDEEKNHDLHQGGPSDLLHHHGPRVHKNQFNIQNQKDECKQLIANIKLIPRRAFGRNATFIGLSLSRIGAAFYQQFGYSHAAGGKCHGSTYQHNQR